MAALDLHIKTANNVSKTLIVDMMASAHVMKTGVEMTAQSTQVNVIQFVMDVMDPVRMIVNSVLKTQKILWMDANV